MSAEPEPQRASLAAARTELTAALEQVQSAASHLTALKQRHGSLLLEKEATKKRLHQEALAQAAEAATAVTKVRLQLQDALQRAREERRHLREQLAGTKSSAALRSEEAAARTARSRQEVAKAQAEVLRVSTGAVDGLLRAIRRAEGSLLEVPAECHEAVNGTAGWLGAVAAAVEALRPTPEGAFGAKQVPDLRHLCEAIRGHGEITAQQWRRLASAAKNAQETRATEEAFTRRLHSLRGRRCELDGHLAEVHQELADLKASIDLEKFRSATLMEEQSWLIPAVAAAVEELGSQTLEPPPGCKDGWPWELNLQLPRPRSCKAAEKAKGRLWASPLGP